MTNHPNRSRRRPQFLVVEDRWSERDRQWKCTVVANYETLADAREHPKAHFAPMTPRMSGNRRTACVRFVHPASGIVRLAVGETISYTTPVLILDGSDIEADLLADYPSSRYHTNVA